jgi:hypothetical protein
MGDQCAGEWYTSLLDEQNLWGMYGVYERFLQSGDFADPILWRDFPRFDANSQPLEGNWGDAGWEWLQKELSRTNTKVLAPGYWNDTVLVPTANCYLYVSNGVAEDVRCGNGDDLCARPVQRLAHQPALLSKFYGFTEAAGQGANPSFSPLLVSHLIDILFHRLRGLEVLRDPFQPSHQHYGEGEIRVAGRVRRTVFDSRSFSLPGLYIGTLISAERFICAQQIYTGAS